MPCHAHPCPCAHVPMCPCAHARLVPPVTQTRPPLLRPQLAPRTRADCTRVWRWVLLGVVVCWSDVSCDASCGYHSWPEASSPFAALGVAIAPPCGVTCGGASLRRAGTWNPEHRASIVVRRSSFVVRGSWVTSSSPHHLIIIISSSPHHHLIITITSSSPHHHHRMALKVRVRYRALDAAQIDARGGLRLQGRDRPRRARRARHSDERVRLQDPSDARDGHDARAARQELVQRGIEREVERWKGGSCLPSKERAPGKKHTHTRLRRASSCHHQEVHPRGDRHLRP